MVFRCAQLELSMFMAQVTGAAVFMDLPVFWRQLHAATHDQPYASLLDAINGFDRSVAL